MSDHSVAPKERINIVYRPATGDASEEVELPLKVLAIGDYTSREDERSIEEREPISVDKVNLDDVMASQDLNLELEVADKLSEKKGGELSVSLDFKSIKDFDPDNIAQNVPELKKILELREALQALKGPLGNVPAIRKSIASILGDTQLRDKLEKELDQEAAKQAKKK